jgi:hypothetical protein
MDKLRAVYDDVENGLLKDDAGREIYAGVGTIIRKSNLSIAATIVISCLLFL